MRLSSRIAAALALTALSGAVVLPAAATPILWDVEYVQQSGNVSVSGSFIYDADLDTYAEVSLLASAASASLSFFTDTLFTTAVSEVPGNTAKFFEAALADQTGQSFIELTTPSLTNAGGTISNDPAFQFGFFAGTCGNATCSNNNSFTVPVEVTSSSLTGGPVPAVPLPAGLPLLLAGLGGLALLSRRARRA